MLVQSLKLERALKIPMEGILGWAGDSCELAYVAYASILGAVRERYAATLFRQ